ncbi:MAG: hypothetical protein CRN43_10700 [Candidatus Nephrothrix sp. EaCA]|nr:MAG: hypothetical protein CRN43_10700 [Candidatus Nephrothrix sp. EaCA]
MFAGTLAEQEATPVATAPLNVKPEPAILATSFGTGGSAAKAGTQPNAEIKKRKTSLLILLFKFDS